jgi:serine/threonine protein kinase
VSQSDVINDEVSVVRGTLPPGVKLRNYKIKAVLGQGGFGVTYLARDRMLHREVAVKEYLPTALAIREGNSSVLPRSTELAQEFLDGRERFLKEARTLARLDEVPGIVQVLDFLEANGTAYMVMKLVRGETLANLINQKAFAADDEFLALLKPLLDGLEKVHQAGFLHRDIKPANIIVDSSGFPTLIDFGASRAGFAERSVVSTAIFTPGFAAPEQFTSAQQGPWTDIYGLSATLYNAILRQKPPNAFERLVADSYSPLVARALPGLTSNLAAGIDAGLRLKAADRPQSIEAWRTLLWPSGPISTDSDTIVVRRPTIAPSPPPLPEAQISQQRRSRKNRSLLYATASVVVLATATSAYIFDLPGRILSPSLQDMNVERLEHVLEERRKAVAAAEERRLEETRLKAIQQAEMEAKQREAEAKQKAEAEARATAEAEAKAKADAVAKQKAEAEAKKVEAEAKQKAEAEAKQKAEAEARATAEAEAKAKADAVAKQKAEAEAKQKAEAEAKQKAEAEAKAEAKAKADAVAKQKAEAEAKQKAEAEAKQKAEAEAKQKAEAEAKQKAEAEARATAEAEAKAKADAVAKQKAEAEAKQKAEAEAKQKAEGSARPELEPFNPESPEIVKAAQQELRRLKCYFGEIDGKPGPQTQQGLAAAAEKLGRNSGVQPLTAAGLQALRERNTSLCPPASRPIPTVQPPPIADRPPGPVVDIPRPNANQAPAPASPPSPEPPSNKPSKKTIHISNF